MASKPKKTDEAADPVTGELIPAQPKSISERAMTLPSGVSVSVARRVTLPVLSMKKVGEPIYFRVETAMKIGKEIKSKDGKPAMEPAHICEVTDLATNRRCQLIVSAVLLGVFNDEYPKDAYVGKSFAVNNMGKRDGKRHNDIEVVELAVTPAAA